MRFHPSLLLLLGGVLGLNRIEFKGSKMFDSVTGEQFFVKGIAYQPGGESNLDVLSDGGACKRDAQYLKQLGVNVVRVYGAVSSKSHDACMAELGKNGIYLMLDLSIPSVSINRAAPRYNIDLLKHYAGNVDAFAKYANLLGFVAGNEVTNNLETTEASAHVKAVLRDTKAYIKSKGLKIPVGYVDNDDPQIRKNIQDYFNCGTDTERADFYAINIYSWCGANTFEGSGYKERTKELEDYSVPVLLGEYGCNQVKPRPFKEIASIFGKDMQDVFSGGFIYEYSQEANDYGLVKINGQSVEKLSDFDTVARELHKVNPKKINAKGYTPKNNHRQCPPISEKWKSHQKLPPTPSEDACQCAYDSLTCRVNKAGSLPENGRTVGEQLGYICEHGACTDVASDPSKGEYGSFSTCNTLTVNSIIFNAAAKDSPCDFKSMAEKSTPKKNWSRCSKLVSNSTSKINYSSPTANPSYKRPAKKNPKESSYKQPTKIKPNLSTGNLSSKRVPETPSYLTSSKNKSPSTITQGLLYSRPPKRILNVRSPLKCRPRPEFY